MIEKGDLITLENGMEYVVFYNINYKDNTYLFLIDKDKNVDMKICMLNGNTLIPVDDINLIQDLLSKFSEV